MSDDRADKDRRTARHARRARIAGWARPRLARRGGGPALILVAGLAAAAVAGALTSARGAPRSDPARVGGGGAQGVFGPHYATLDQRREAAHIPTMMKTMNSPVHFHAHLTLWMNGKRVPIPAGIGIDPTQDAMQMAGLHTHDSSGTIHVEGVEGSTLGQFFAIWGLPLTAERVGPFRARGANRLRIWVNGRTSRGFADLKLGDGQRIVISYGTGEHQPTG